MSRLYYLQIHRSGAKRDFGLKKKDYWLVRFDPCIRYTNQTKHPSTETKTEGKMYGLEGWKSRSKLE
jgi:hypothetical protein